MAYYEKNRESILKYFDSYLGWSARMISRKRDRAKNKGIEFDLDLKWFRGKLANNKCEVTGLPFYKDYWRRGKAHPFAPTIDKTDPSKGYTKDNVKVVCWVYNTAKHDNTHNDVLIMAKALIAAQK